MADPVLWALVTLQIGLGLFDVLYHHEFMARLPWKSTAQHELVLHSVRNLFYAVIFITLAWHEPKGVWALSLCIILILEVLLTLWDFVEEDKTRLLPPSERITHTLLALNYGAILAFLLPELYAWSQQPTELTFISYGLFSLFLTLAAAGVLVFAARDILASRRMASISQVNASELAKSLPPGQSILITGATGFIGERLTEALLAHGHFLTILTRNPEKATKLGAPITVLTDLDQIPDGAWFDTIVNLAGESVASGLWTEDRRKKIISSRVDMTNALVELMRRLDHPPTSFINASATGWYGIRDDEVLSEDDPGKDCFAHQVCKLREEASDKASELGVRVVNLRIGIVLGYQGGALAQMLPAFDLCGGGPMGNGKQWMSWIERDDMIRLIIHTIQTPELTGPVNAVAPHPVQNKEFARALGRALFRPAFIPVPAWVLKLALGDLAKELLLRGQRVSADKVLKSGFHFKHETLDRALKYTVGGG